MFSIVWRMLADRQEALHRGLSGLEVAAGGEALRAAELGAQGEQPVRELVLLGLELLGGVRVGDLLDRGLDLGADLPELGRERLLRGRALAERLDPVEEQPDLLGLLGEIAAAPAATAAAPAAARGEKDQRASEHHPRRDSACQRARDCNALGGR